MSEETDDPLLSADPQKRSAYREDVMKQMREAINEDRAARRSKPLEDSSPGPIVGATGLAGGLYESF